MLFQKLLLMIMIKISKINPQDTVLDEIHKIQEKNYKRTKNLSPREFIDYYQKTTDYIIQNNGYYLFWDKKNEYGKLIEK